MTGHIVGRQIRRVIITVLVLGLASAAAVVSHAAQEAGSPRPQAEAIPADLRPQATVTAIPAPPKSDQTVGISLSEARREARERRLREGAIPIAEQLAALRAALPDGRALQAHVVATFRKPVPIQEFTASVQGAGPVDLTFLQDPVITVYLELDSGYPVSYTTRLSKQPVAAIRSYLLGPLSSIDGTRGEGESPAAAALRAQAQESATTVENRAVVLGVTLPIKHYRDVSGRIAAAWPVAAREISADAFAPAFTATGARFTEAFVSRLGEEFQAGAK